MKLYKGDESFESKNETIINAMRRSGFKTEDEMRENPGEVPINVAELNESMKAAASRIEELEGIIVNLNGEKSEAEKDISKLKSENSKLKTENGKLKAELEALKQN